MKNIVLVIAAVLVCLNVVLAQQVKVNMTSNQNNPQTAAQPPVADPDLRGVKWGMNLDDIKRIERIEPSKIDSSSKNTMIEFNDSFFLFVGKQGASDMFRRIPFSGTMTFDGFYGLNQVKYHFEGLDDDSYFKMQNFIKKIFYKKLGTVNAIPNKPEDIVIFENKRTSVKMYTFTKIKKDGKEDNMIDLVYDWKEFKLLDGKIPVTNIIDPSIRQEDQEKKF